MKTVTNVVFAGIGGQGVLKASDILAQAAFYAGLDVKKSELHGMSQRGGAVTGDVRFGEAVLSPMIPDGEADYLVVFEPDQRCLAERRLAPGGALIEPSAIDAGAPANRRCLNVALLGALSLRLTAIPESAWLEAMKFCLPPKTLDANRGAFELGRRTGCVPA